MPAIGEFVPGYEASSLFGLGAPKSTPNDVIDLLNSESNAALADSKFKMRLANLDGMAMGGAPADFGRIIAAETEKLRSVIKLANIKLE